MLDLGMMGLKTVHPAALHGLESLRLLSLSQNQLAQLPERFLEPVPKLRKLLLGGRASRGGIVFMRGNLLEELPAEFFAYTPDLTVLDVSENRLQRCSFPQLTKLRDLDLGMNRISQLPADAFQELTALETLNLRWNKLLELPEQIFQNLTSLKLLYLHGNGLTYLPVICERAFCFV